MRSSQIVRSMDTSGDQEISVSIMRDPFVSGGHLVRLADTTMIPSRSMILTVAEARKLAEFLIEQADEADEANDA